jgi:hypothetical protein
LGIVVDVPNPRQVDAGTWSLILSRILEAGIAIEERGEDQGLFWCYCRRGRASLGLGASSPPHADRGVYLWCGSKRFWSAPLATRRLARDLVAIVKT